VKISTVRVTEIIPALCESKREASLLRAIASIRDGSATPTRIIVVVNGDQFDPALLQTLMAGGDDEVRYTRLAQVPANPLAELFEENWLHNCNHTFRTVSVPGRYFQDPQKYMEWTWLAFRVAISGKRVATSDKSTFRYHNTPGSLFAKQRRRLPAKRHQSVPSKAAGIPPSRHQEDHGSAPVRRMTLDSGFELDAGNKVATAKAHCLSVVSHPSGFRYIRVTRQLFRRTAVLSLPTFPASAAEAAHAPRRRTDA